MNKTTLYGRGVYGIKEWSIWSEDGKIVIEANGSIYTETVNEGKASRSLAEQIELRINARIRGKLDNGFKRSIEELGAHNTNQLGYAMPMLAVNYKDIVLNPRRGIYVQPKFDGHRCLINGDGAYSRRGKPIETIPEILDSLDVPDGITLDGELYCHGVPLQTIASWAKRRQADTLKLQFYIYDAIIPGVQFEERAEILKEILKPKDNIVLVESAPFDSSIGASGYCKLMRSKGYEGAILRYADSEYEIGTRSKSLIKVKMRYDGEFKCVDIEPSREGLGILILELPNGNTFKTIAPGTVGDKVNALLNKEKYIGKMVTCEWAELTESGVPFHCIATGWRADI